MMNDVQAAKALGYYSIALGAFELLGARGLSRILGIGDARIVRAFGAREVANGLAILTKPDNSMGLWARVGGDVMDLGLLGASMAGSSRHRGNATIAAAAVGSVLVLDVLCALALGHRADRAIRTAQRSRYKRVPA